MLQGTLTTGCQSIVEVARVIRHVNYQRVQGIGDEGSSARGECQVKDFLFLWIPGPELFGSLSLLISDVQLALLI